jgi:phosphate acyltransferase
MKIAVDAMGGDFAPAAIVAGAVLAAPQLAEMGGEIVLVGQEDVVRAELAKQGLKAPNVSVHHAPQVVGMDESARLALRQKADSSVTVSVDLVRDGLAEAAVSAGNSGALMAAATMRLRCLPGVQRPAIAVAMPTPIGRRLVLDAGANVDCKPEHLADFALMGSLYCEYAQGIERPRVGLLSIGTEECKGNELSFATAELLRQLPINFIGNVEGNSIYQGEVDVTVCDGFVGNVVLKVTEGVGQELMDDLKTALKSSFWAKLGALIARPALKRMGHKYDYAEYGGALLLGVNGVCIVAHGKSNARATAAAIMVGAQSAASRVQDRMVEAFQKLRPTVEAPVTP